MTKTLCSNEQNFYDYGMHLVQLAIKSHAAGNQALCNDFCNDFIFLCNNIIKSKESLITPNDQVFEHLKLVNEFRIKLKDEINYARNRCKKESVHEIVEALNKVNQTCQILEYCLSHGFLPPKIEENKLRFSTLVINDDVGKDEVIVTIKKITVNVNDNCAYSVSVYPPKSEAVPTITDKFHANEQVQFKIPIKCLDRNKSERLSRMKKKNIIIELNCFSKKMLKTVQTKVAELKFPMLNLGSKSFISKEYIMNPTENAAKDAQYLIEVEVKINTALYQEEYEEKEISYYTIAKGAQIPKPPSYKTNSKERSMNDLSSDEKKQLASLLVPCKILEDWELERFMSLQLLKHIKDITNKNIESFQKFKVIVPPKLISQSEIISQKINTLLDLLKKKSLSLEEYKQKIRSQISLDIQEIKKRGKESPEGKVMLERLQIMVQERDGFEKK